MLDYKKNTGFYEGVTADCKLIPTPEFQRSITAYYARNGIPFRTPEHWNTARAFDSAPAPQSARAARLHRSLDFVMDRMAERRRRGRDCNRERDRRDDTRVAADANLRTPAEPLDDWGKPFPPDSARGLREHAEETYRAGERAMGVRDDYARAAFAYRPGPARAADAGQGGDLEWMQSGAWASTGGVI
jgi:hypothetical protein